MSARAPVRAPALAAAGVLRALAGACLLLAGAGSCADGSPSAATPVVPPPIDTLLGSQRLAALPPGERGLWTTYMDSSHVRAQRDRALVDAEARAAGLASWQPAPLGPDFYVTSAMTDAWLAGPDAHRIGEAILSFQTPTGGWSKAVDVTTRPRRPGEGWSSGANWTWISTFDNGATTEELRFLGAVVRAQGDTLQRAGFLRGLDYIFLAQFANGCWPQVYPLEGWYHDAVTYNDDATVRILRLLVAVARGDYPFVPAAARARAGAAVTAGVGCILASQVVVAGKKTVWGAQHDPLTLAPVQGRAYEPASLCSLESATVVDFLMERPVPGGDVVAAAHAAAAWFRATAIRGYVYTNGELTASPGAGPLWARFSELSSNRPIFGDRDGSVHYALKGISQERQLGYAWYTTSPGSTLQRYDAWAPSHP